MQFYDFFRDLLNYIPGEYSIARTALFTFLPYALMACALFTAFFALKCGKWWCALTFFFLGVSVSSQYILPEVDLYRLGFWVMLGVCISIGIFCAYFSKYLYRLQLVGSMFMLVYAALPSFILFLGDTVSKIVSAVVGAALAFLSIKYRYIITIATTSFSGSFIFWGVVSEQFGVGHKVLFAVLMGIFALLFQCMMNFEMLRDTYFDVKKKYEKTKKGIAMAGESVKRHKDSNAEAGQTDGKAEENSEYSE